MAEEVEQALAEPLFPSRRTGEDEEQDDPAYKPAQTLPDEKRSDGQGPLQKSKGAETGPVHGLGYHCFITVR